MYMLTHVSLVPTVFKYLVETHTAYMPGSGTDANVYIELYGERGDTGRRKLLHSHNEGDKFETGKVELPFNSTCKDK